MRKKVILAENAVNFQNSKLVPLTGVHESPSSESLRNARLVIKHVDEWGLNEDIMTQLLNSPVEATNLNPLFDVGDANETFSPKDASNTIFKHPAKRYTSLERKMSRKIIDMSRWAVSNLDSPSRVAPGFKQVGRMKVPESFFVPMVLKQTNRRRQSM